MTDAVLQRVWDSREAISRRCGYDSRKLVLFYQARQKPEARPRSVSAPTADSATAGRRATRRKLINDLFTAPQDVDADIGVENPLHSTFSR